jgi:hypothetical protein
MAYKLPWASPLSTLQETPLPRWPLCGPLPTNEAIGIDAWEGRAPAGDAPGPTTLTRPAARPSAAIAAATRPRRRVGFLTVVLLLSIRPLGAQRSRPRFRWSLSVLTAFVHYAA